MSATEQGIAVKAAPAFDPGYSIKRVCSYCKEFLGLKTCTKEMHGETSHGICEACAEKHFGPAVLAKLAGN